MHIHSIKSIESVVEDAAKFYQRFDPQGAHESILNNQNANVREVDGLMFDLLDRFKKRVNGLKSEIISQDKKLLENVMNKENFLSQSKEVTARKLQIDVQQLMMLQNFLKSEGVKENPPIKVEADHYIKKFNEVFDDCFKIVRNGINVESTEPRAPKVE